ncbi:hypothetical protein ACQP1W_24340 [Spirillospora sp. CA-255316]
MEIPELRDFIRTRLCDGRYPQMPPRLGASQGPEPESVRRPADAMISEEPGSGEGTAERM